MFLFRLESELVNREHIQQKTNILNLSHLQTAFYILFIGCVVSVATFLGELLQQRMDKKKCEAN